MKQFGALKAIGVTNGKIRRMVAAQAGLVGLIGYGLGVLGTVGFVVAFSSDPTFKGFYIPWQIPLISLVAVALILGLTGWLALRSVPTEGEVKVFGTDIYDLSDDELVEFRLNNIGFIFQQYNLIPSIDAASNAAVPLMAQGMDREEARMRAVAMLEKLNIGDQAAKLPNQLSGGQQQRVAIARALVHEPRLVVCDEPTAALDASSGRRVMDLLREVAVAENRACIIVTHDNRIFDLADRILVLEDGVVTHDGTEMPEDH
ncbi:ATP-binding cassette domain-containing protein [Erythrobacter vulgaris]|uniref:ATP-binding cassette domain-containing protein n=1 Tax=Qipengyuania vulgaris TaxID=291985 RepID=A0A844XT46_9SPHN|nr:ATP-binding cassette domain-containing protein [Qipengyuania vulgaris]